MFFKGFFVIFAFSKIIIEILKTINYILLFLCCWFTACTGNWQRWVGSSDEEVEIQRYDKVMFDFVSLNSYSALQRLNTEFSLQTSMLIEDVLGIGSVQDPSIDRRLRAFYQDSTLQKLYSEVLRQYTDLEPEEKLLTKVFQALKQEDSSFVVPCIYTQVCALNESIVINDSVVGVGLDKYLGADFPLYCDYYYAYQRRTMERDQIVPDILFYYLGDFYASPANRSLLQRMIFAGKIHWVIAHLTGKTLYEEMNFTGERRAWCISHEKRVWKWMKDNGMLESTDWVRIMEFMEPREYTIFFGPESADQLGLWLGGQIVDSYMKHNKDKQWQDLLHISSDTIYQYSGYNP